MINKNVLIVEEDSGFRNAIIAQFREVGVTKCVGAEDGFSGVQEILKFQNQSRHFDLIVADLRLPKINGYKLITELRKRFPQEKIPFVMMMTEADRDKLDKILEAGINDHIFKPFNLEKLKECLKKVWNIDEKEFEVKKLAPAAGNPLLSLGQANASLDNAFADIGKTKKASAPPVTSFNFGGASSGGKKETSPVVPSPAAKEEKPKEMAPVKTVSSSQVGSGSTGSSYLAKATTLVPEDMEPGPVDRNVPIDGVYFKLIQLVHGVDKNYFWAKEVQEKELVELYLLTRSCKKSGMLLETVGKRDFCRTYFSSERYGCDLDGYGG